MKVLAIRGATTIEQNSIVDIIDGTKELLKCIIEANGLEREDIISIIFTMTKDLDAAFPAVAARQIGWTDIALLCMNELDISGSLKQCVRVLIHINTDKEKSDMKHIYLKGAKVLRPDLLEN